MTYTRKQLETFLALEDFQEIYAQADALRAETVGDIVHIRALLEFSNHCKRLCCYCGLNREAQPIEDAARSLLLGVEPELAALRLLVVIPGKRLPHARVQRQLDEPAVILPLDGEDALQQDRLVLPLNLPPPVALRLEHVGSFLSVPVA